MYATRALRMFRPTNRMMRPASNQAPGIMARLRNIPAELLPLGVVVGFALFAAGYSITRHLVIDKSIRLKRQNRIAEGAHEGHAEHEAAPAAEAAEPAAEEAKN